MTPIQSTKEAYQESLIDPRWKSLRQKIIRRDRYQCQCCGSTSQLHVHHRQYHRHKHSGEWLKPWEYSPQFLVTLCDTCHRAGHQHYSIPIKDI
ncbi:HNH endonuclease [Algoriphagus kandeliae]|uniref:HNH endonuclease n=1 Tax=Algoriphagus kandeliae TaxID=2562278 RepID=A0A4Y9QS71_9BACT|nr:HNH endonuclease [Algoriphagus kandeliae]